MKTRTLILVLFPLFIIGIDLTGQIQIFNGANDYIEYYNSTEGLSDESKVEYFNQMVYSKAAAVYENIYSDIKWIGQNVEERVLSYRKKFKAIKKQYSELSSDIAPLLLGSLSTFQEKFSEPFPEFHIYILHSLGIRAGGLIQVEGKDALMFGVDQIATYLSDQNLNPFFHHELTHLYHNIYYTPAKEGDYKPGALYNFLWREGMAVYVSALLNPEASQKEIFLRDSLSIQSEKVIDIIAKDLLVNLYSTDTENIKKYFWQSSEDAVIPITAGYYVGYVLVKEMARRYSLDELIIIKEETYLPEIENILESMIAIK